MSARGGREVFNSSQPRPMLGLSFMTRRTCVQGEITPERAACSMTPNERQPQGTRTTRSALPVKGQHTEQPELALLSGGTAGHRRAGTALAQGAWERRRLHWAQGLTAPGAALSGSPVAVSPTGLCRGAESWGLRPAPGMSPHLTIPPALRGGAGRTESALCLAKGPPGPGEFPGWGRAARQRQIGSLL